MAEDTLYSYIELGASNGPLDCLAATDFLTVDVWTLVGLATHYLLFVIDISSRSVYNVQRRQRLGGMLSYDREVA